MAEDFCLGICLGMSDGIHEIPLGVFNDKICLYNICLKVFTLNGRPESILRHNRMRWEGADQKTAKKMAVLRMAQ